MFITYRPADKSERRAHTNLGEFAPGDCRGPFEGANEKEARRLVANGDFVETDAGGVEIESSSEPAVTLPDEPPAKTKKK